MLPIHFIFTIFCFGLDHLEYLDKLRFLSHLLPHLSKYIGIFKIRC